MAGARPPLSRVAETHAARQFFLRGLTFLRHNIIQPFYPSVSSVQTRTKTKTPSRRKKLMA
jgi:hypothetical protein